MSGPWQAPMVTRDRRAFELANRRLSPKMPQGTD